MTNKEKARIKYAIHLMDSYLWDLCRDCGFKKSDFLKILMEEINRLYINAVVWEREENRISLLPCKECKYFTEEDLICNKTLDSLKYGCVCTKRFDI